MTGRATSLQRNRETAMRAHRTVWRLASTMATATLVLTGCANPSPRVTSEARNPGSPEASTAAIGNILHGPLVWRRTANALTMAPAGSQRFSTVALPAGVSATSVASITGSPSGTLWLAQPTAAAVNLFRSSTAGRSWAKTTLNPRWGADIVGAIPNDVSVDASDGGIVTVVAAYRQTRSESVPRLFISTDGGASFTQAGPPRMSDMNSSWWSRVFLTARQGVVVSGPGIDQLNYTSDGGSTWHPSTLGLPASSRRVLGPLQGQGSDIAVLAAVAQPDGSEKATVLVSHDGGASFTGTVAAPVTTEAEFEPTPVPAASFGTTWWLVPPTGGELLASRDNGRSWETLRTASLPQNVTAVTMSSAAAGTANVNTSSCAQGKTQCTTQEYLLTTTDGGATWTRQ